MTAKKWTLAMVCIWVLGAVLFYGFHLERTGAFLSGLTIVGNLGMLINWALQCRRARTERGLHPRCKHGVRKWSLPKCEECGKEDEIFFAQSDLPQSIEVHFKKEVPIKFDLVPDSGLLKIAKEWAKRGIRPSEDLWRFNPEQNSHLCRTCGYEVDVIAAVNNGTAAFGHACPPVAMRYCAEPNCTYSQPVVQCWFHGCRGTGVPSRWREKGTEYPSNPPEPKFRVGQWVRIKTEHGCSRDGELRRVQEYFRSGYVVLEGDRHTIACPVTWTEGALESAAPRDGEWWQAIHSECARCNRGTGLNVLCEFQYWARNPYASLMAAWGCLVPVNFGKGNR